MGKANKSWHEQNRMPKNATLQQRIAWHVAHAKACRCRCHGSFTYELRSYYWLISWKSNLNLTA